MSSLKVECDCGQRYSFDVIPVNGQMPFVVNCPICGADGTGKANAILATQPMAAAAVAVPVAAAVAAPRAGLRVQQSAAHAPTAASVAQTTYAAPPSPADYPTSKPEREPNFWLGVLGAVIGGVVGMLTWYFIYKTTGMRLGFLAIGVGVLTGFAARWIGRYHSTNMGLVTGLCALLFIIGSQYMRAKDEMSLSDTEFAEMYDADLDAAKELLKDIPNGTDAEIRAYLEKEEAELSKEEGTGAEPIVAEEIQFFKTAAWQPAHDLVSGKRTKEDVRKEWQEGEDALAQSTAGKVIFWIKALGIFNIVSICIGVGTAYKIGAGED